MKTSFGSVLRTRRRGFTLVELLVVIAIIGVLVALLLPAVQQAREAGRRSQCLNNMKQLGIGLHNHHDQLRKLPPGSAWDQQTESLGMATGAFVDSGSSWMIYMLPFLEQRALYDKYIFSNNANPPRSGSGRLAANLSLLNNIQVPGYFCPSSPLPRSATVSGNRIQAGTYAGISGAGATGTTTIIANYSDGRQSAANGGLIAANGTLFPNSILGFQDLQDGLSNVMVIGEEGDWMFQAPSSGSGGGPTKVDWRSQGQNSADGGFHLGASGTAANAVNVPGAATNPYNGSTNGMITIATLSGTSPAISAINLKKAPGGGGWSAGTASGGQGSTGPTQPNNPLRSAHPGGICILIGDGSSRFIPQTITMDVLARLAIRDDGNPVEMP